MQFNRIWEVIAMTNSINLRGVLRQLSVSSSKAGLDTGSSSTAAPQYIALIKSTFFKWHISHWHASKPSKVPAGSVIRRILSFSYFIWRPMKKLLELRKSVFQIQKNIFHYAMKCIRSEYVPNTQVMYKMDGLICWYKCYKNNIAVSISHWAVNLMKLKCVLNSSSTWVKRVSRSVFLQFLSPLLWMI